MIGVVKELLKSFCRDHVWKSIGVAMSSPGIERYECERCGKRISKHRWGSK